MFALSNRLILNEDLAWSHFSPFSFIKAAASFVRYSLHRRTLCEHARVGQAVGRTSA
jgi:hypothetical protein